MHTNNKRQSIQNLQNVFHLVKKKRCKSLKEELYKGYKQIINRGGNQTSYMNVRVSPDEP